jgi:uncharacterized YigZ family protein
MGLSQDTYKTISRPSTGLFKDRGSKFIALAYPVREEEEIRQILEDVKSRYHDARHHCHAWVLKPDQSDYRMNDDGEPAGTAGRPVYGQILSLGLTDVLVIVVRYFGGTKLGVRGLINAYKGAARDALEQAGTVTRTVEDILEVHFEYPLMNDVMRLVKEWGLEQRGRHFDMQCRLDLAVRRSRTRQVADAFDRLHGVRVVRPG